MKPSAYLPWLGELIPVGREYPDTYRLKNPQLSAWHFSILTTPYLDFLFRGIKSPVPLCAKYPVRAVQTNKLSKDPFAMVTSRPVIPKKPRWYWSPLFGWCYYYGEGTSIFHVATPYLQNILDLQPSEQTETPPFRGCTTLWGHRMMKVVLSISPIFYGPQTFILQPL